MDFPLRTPDQLAVLLRSFRQARKLSQKALAAKLGITQQALSQLEQDPQSASFERVMGLLAALQVVVVLRDADRTASGETTW